VGIYFLFKGVITRNVKILVTTQAEVDQAEGRSVENSRYNLLTGFFFCLLSKFQNADFASFLPILQILLNSYKCFKVTSWQKQDPNYLQSVP